MWRVLLLLSVWATIVSSESGLDDKDLQPEETQRRIHDIIQSHENYKYGQHGGHEYDDNINNGPKDYRHTFNAPHREVPRHKNQGYFILQAAKPYSGISKKLKPLDSKIYDYYPKIDSEEKYAVGPKTIIYYPEKKLKDYDDIEDGHHTAPDPGLAPHTEHPVPVIVPHAGHPVPIREHLAPPPPPISHHTVVGSHSAYDPIPPKKPYLPVKPLAPRYVAVAPHEPPLPKKEYILHENPHYPAPHSEVHIKGSHHGAHDHKESKYDDHGNDYHGDHLEEKHQGHSQHKDYEVSGHKSHAAHAGHHDQHSKYHNKGSYERDRGYHYEKAYAYDRIRAHHDIGKSHDSHSDYKGQHAHEGHHKKGHHGGHSYMYFKKGGKYGDHQHGKSAHLVRKNSYFKKGHDYDAHVPPVLRYGPEYKYR